MEIDTDRPLQLAVKAIQSMMNGDESEALSYAMSALTDAEDTERCPNVMQQTPELRSFKEGTDFDKQMVLITLLAAAARDHKPSEPGALY